MPPHAQPTGETTSLREIGERYFPAERGTSERTRFIVHLVSQIVEKSGSDADTRFPVEARQEVMAQLVQNLHDRVDQLIAETGSEREADLVGAFSKEALAELTRNTRETILKINHQSTDLATLLSNAELPPSLSVIVQRENADIMTECFDRHKAIDLWDMLSRVAKKGVKNVDSFANELREAVLEAIQESANSTTDSM